MLKVDADDASDAFGAAFDRLAKDGKQPTAAQVVAEVDRKERARFKRLGIDPDAALKLPAKKAANGNATTKTNGAPMKVANQNAPKSREEILAELDRLDA